MNNGRLTIVMMTHNRPAQAFEALKSILNQSNQNYQITISDNSSNSDFQELVRSTLEQNAKLRKINYIKRSQVYSAIDHWNVCLAEISTEYFCLFHDDDLMLDNFVDDFWIAQKKFPNAVAMGCNAILREIDGPDKPYFKSKNNYITGITAKELFAKYFSRHQMGVAPFPSYIYKTSLLNGAFFDFSKGGKYCDVTWLLELAQKAEVIWINKLMMIYHMHSENYGITESKLDRLTFLAYIKKNRNTYGTGLLSDYRFFIYKKILPTFQNSDKCCERIDLLSFFMRRYRLIRWFRLDHWLQFLKKIYIKL
jgi:glycosyltransferase involved in cell wall biosynthesis